MKKGDWAGLVDYQETPMLLKKYNTLKRVIDVGYIEYKGKMRKLVLTEDGLVYKVKEAKH